MKQNYEHCLLRDFRLFSSKILSNVQIQRNFRQLMLTALSLEYNLEICKVREFSGVQI